MVYQLLGQIGNSFGALPTLIAGGATLIILLGWPAICGLVWVFFTIFMGMNVAKRSKGIEGKTSAVATERLNTCTNIIGAIKAIKYFTWEQEFLDELAKSRGKEIDFLRQ